MNKIKSNLFRLKEMKDVALEEIKKIDEAIAKNQELLDLLNANKDKLKHQNDSIKMLEELIKTADTKKKFYEENIAVFDTILANAGKYNKDGIDPVDLTVTMMLHLFTAFKIETETEQKPTK